jgi:TatD DNase family protein
MPFYIDTHAHLYLPEFDKDRDTVIETALHRGVQKMFLPNIDSSTIEPMNTLASRFPGVCYPMMGLHPTSVKKNYREELAQVEYELEHGHYAGIGETGIDLYWDKTYFQEQCLAFSRQIELSILFRLPLIIHARESFAEILEILESYKGRGLSGIFHAFTGTVEMAKQVTAMGFKLGIGGIVTYKNSDLPDVVRETDLSDLVLETDSPYLTPVPFRGKRNESSYIPYIAAAVQQIKNIPLEEVATITSRNVLTLFSINSNG